MSDRRHRSTVPTLPEGYQFGESRPRLFLSPEVMATLRRFPLPNMHEMYRKYRAWMATQPPISVEDAERWFTAADESTAHRIAGNVELPGKTGETITVECTTDPGWRAPHENDAAQLRRRQDKSGPVLINLCPEHPAALAFEKAIRNKTLRIVESQRTGDETV